MKQWTWNELGDRLDLPRGGFASVKAHRDAFGRTVSELSVNSGRLTFTVLPERGMDIGELVVDGEKRTWERDGARLLHPDSVDLRENGGTGWLSGFYAAVASIGPELFGTPGEGYTLHGTASYSPAEPGSVTVRCGEDGVAVEGEVRVRGYGEVPVFVKKIRVFAAWGAAAIVREEETRNVSDAEQVLDDGYHIQLSGPYLHEGGRYVLPVPAHALLLRDSAPGEADPLRIPAIGEGLTPMRCYQYVPGRVDGLETIGEVGGLIAGFDRSRGLTAEMVVSRSGGAAGYVIRPLACFPRSLIAKEAADSFLFSFEPCRTRPNRMSQKITDGEALFLCPGESASSQCLIGTTRDVRTIAALERAIAAAASRLA